MQSVKVRTRRIKFWISLFRAYLSRYRLQIGSTILVTTILVISSAKLFGHLSSRNAVTIGFAGNYTLETVPTEVLALATDPLISIDKSGKSTPSLASHWPQAEDGKTYLVFLKDNLKWHDDTQVEAKDITIAIENVTITALNNKTLEFRLPSSLSSFPTALNRPVFKTESFYGTGKFRIVAIDSQKEIIKKISMVPKEEGLPHVDIKFYPTEQQLMTAIKIGDVKYARVTNAKLFERWQNMNVKREVDNTQVVTIFFNTQDELLSSVDLRQSLIYSINRSNFDGTPATGPISPENWAYSQDVGKYEYNTGKAKELLTKSQVKSPKITFSVHTGLMDVANSIKKDWEDLGIKVELKEENALTKDFQAFLAVEKLPPDPDQYALWHSTQTTTNLTRLKDVRIDKLLEDARSAQKEDERKNLYASFQKDLLNAAPAAFLYHPYIYQVVYKNQAKLVDMLPKN